MTVHDGPEGVVVAAGIVDDDHAGDGEAAVDVERHETVGKKRIGIGDGGGSDGRDRCGRWHEVNITQKRREKKKKKHFTSELGVAREYGRCDGCAGARMCRRIFAAFDPPIGRLAFPTEYRGGVTVWYGF